MTLTRSNRLTSMTYLLDKLFAKEFRMDININGKIVSFAKSIACPTCSALKIRHEGEYIIIKP